MLCVYHAHSLTIFPCETRQSSENVRETKLTRQLLFTKAVCCKGDNIATVC
jgi:hypothetical protein